MKFKTMLFTPVAVLIAFGATISSSAVTNEDSIEFITDGVDFHQVAINEVFPDIKPEEIKAITFSFSADVTGLEATTGQIAVNSPSSGWKEADFDLSLLGGTMTTSLDVSFLPDDEWYHCSVATWGFESGVVIDLLNASGLSLIHEAELIEPEESEEPEETEESALDEELNESGETIDTEEDQGYVKGMEQPDTGIELITPLVISVAALGTMGIASRIRTKKNN